MILLGTLFVALQGAGIKLLDGALGWEQIVFLRSAILAGFLAPIVIRRGVIKTARPGMHAARGLVGIFAMSCMVYALLEAPFADVTAISFSRALFVVILAIILLKEVVRWRRWSAVAIGFAGVVLMLRPGEDGVSTALLFAVAGAFLGAWVVMILKSLSTTEAAETIVFWFGVSGVVLMAIPAALAWNWPSAIDWLILFGLSAAGSLAQYFLVRGWALGEASAVAPVGYAQLVWAVLLGIILFAEIPDVWTFLGAGIIVASTLYIAVGENNMKPAASVNRRHPDD